jgi:Flp pilus assembly protein TadG
MPAEPTPSLTRLERLRDFCARCLLRARGQLGSSLLEFGVASALLLTVMFGIVDFGRGLYAYDAISEAARIGTRYAIVRGSSSSAPVSASTVAWYVQNNCCAGLNPTSINVTTTWSPNNTPGSTVKVQVQYSLTFMFPYLPTSSISMSASSQMVISQ